jgi:hypothetical protein
MSKTTLNEALEASVDALYKPKYRFLALMPILKHVERFLGWFFIVSTLVWFIPLYFDWKILKYCIPILEIIVWTFAVWLAVQKRRYHKQVDLIAWSCSHSTGMEFEADERFKGLINMYYVDLKVKELLNGTE